MTAQMIDGKQVAASIRAELTQHVASLRAAHGLQPGLAVVLVGNNPASEVYVRNKHKATLDCGMLSFEYRLPDTTTEHELLSLIEKLNHDDAVHGILVQLPLPPQINDKAVINAIAPAKDVDGFHVVNAGRLAVGLPAMIPCTPKGCLHLLKMVQPRLAGLHAVVIGRSNIVGKPMAQLLLAESCTVTITHSKTKNLADEIARADIVVAAIGQPFFVKGEWIKPGAIVIDVGINRIDDTTRASGTRLVGDVDYDAAIQRASAITPVPGGVGPMTIACLLDNTVKAACLIAGVERPRLSGMA